MNFLVKMLSVIPAPHPAICEICGCRWRTGIILRARYRPWEFKPYGQPFRQSKYLCADCINAAYHALHTSPEPGQQPYRSVID